MKFCPRCGLTKPLEAFGKNRRTKSGYGAYCRECHGKMQENWRKANPEKARDILKVHRYGITHEELAILRDKQGGRCAICEVVLTFTPKPRHTRECVDHNHETGEVRGLLCHACNVALGLFQDDERRLMKAADYLR